MNEHGRMVVVVVDHENLVYALRDQFGVAPDLARLLDHVETSLGRVDLVGCYANFVCGTMASEKVAINQLGGPFKALQVDTRNAQGDLIKGAVDDVIVDQLLDLFDRFAAVRLELVLVTGDGGLYRRVRQMAAVRGVSLTAIAVSTAAHCEVHNAPRVTYYDRQIVPLVPLPPVSWSGLLPVERRRAGRAMARRVSRGGPVSHAKLAEAIAPALVTVDPHRAKDVVTAAKRASVLVSVKGGGLCLSEVGWDAYRPGLWWRFAERLSDLFHQLAASLTLRPTAATAVRPAPNQALAVSVRAA